MFRAPLPISVPAIVLFCASPIWLQAKPASDASPKAVLEQGLRELMQIADNEKGASPVHLAKKVRPTLERFFNFEGLTKRAIGQGWKELSADHQKQAISLFSEILIRSYAARFDWNNKLEIIFSSPVDLGNGRVEVPATSRYAGNTVNVVYRMEQAANGWAVYDVVIEGVSMSSNYRAQFDSVRQKNGAEGLLKSMQDNLKQ